MKIFSACTEISIRMTEDLPSWSKPFVRIVVYGITIIAYIILLPLYPIMNCIFEKRNNAFRNLCRKLEITWETQSSVVERENRATEDKPMTTEGFKRKLTTIFSAGVAHYSRLMGEDEAATVRTLTVYRGIMVELIKQHGGRIIDSPSDNRLTESTSAVDAV